VPEDRTISGNSPRVSGNGGARYDPGIVDERAYPQIIDGREHRAGELHSVIDPSTGETFATWAEATAQEVDAALGAARRGFDSGVWSRLPLARRAEILEAASDAIRREATRLVTLESLDTGKTISGARHFDLYEAASAFAYGAAVCRVMHGDVRKNVYPPELFPDGGPEITTLRSHDPAGVVCELLPWNAPLMTGSQRMAAGLAAGCALVVKPPEEAVVTTVNLVRLLHAVGVPPEVLHVVLGRGETVGEQLVSDPRVDLVSLTGSVPTGMRVMAMAARNLTRVHLELGGKAPVIVFDDADVDDAVRWASAAAFVNAGQVCVAGSRLLVGRGLYDDVVGRLVDGVKGFVVGDALAEETFIGPLITAQHAERVRGFVERAVGAADATVAVEGELPADSRGNFVAPTVLADVRPGSEIEQEEVFGPVLATLAFSSEDEAVTIANGTRFGLNATVFTRDIERAFRMSDRLCFGEINVNCHFTPDMNGSKGEPQKMSGISAADVEAYTTRKAVNLRTR
jgi:acyl-CoA reductase-like NAD-dependent aldehyde dehydrogenase